MDPEDRTGKVPKFWFGNKPTVRANNLDVPGVGNVDIDQPPKWMKSVSYVFGTDRLPSENLPMSHIFPGPGEYEII